jgi:UDP-N-acetylmuramate: L-alanyl-gamma-D-glutamyl-meso-diaminopimelate ligase
MRTHFIISVAAPCTIIFLALHNKGYQVTGMMIYFEPSKSLLDKKRNFTTISWFPEKITRC